MSEHPLRERLAELSKRKEEALHAGPERAVQRQHEKGKLLARERIDYLLDPGSFHELDMLSRSRAGETDDDRPYTDGVITGFGTIDGRKVCVFSQDFTVFGGAAAGQHVELVEAARIEHLLDALAGEQLALLVLTLHRPLGAGVEGLVLALGKLGQALSQRVLRHSAPRLPAGSRTGPTGGARTRRDRRSPHRGVRRWSPATGWSGSGWA